MTGGELIEVRGQPVFDYLLWRHYQAVMVTVVIHHDVAAAVAGKQVFSGLTGELKFHCANVDNTKLDDRPVSLDAPLARWERDAPERGAGSAQRGAGARLRDATVEPIMGASPPILCASAGSDPKGSLVCRKIGLLSVGSMRSQVPGTVQHRQVRGRAKIGVSFFW